MQEAASLPAAATIPAISLTPPGDALLAGKQGTSRIMIVDDEPINIEVPRKFLKQAGYTDVIATTEARQAMRMIRQQAPDLLLLDILMPGVNGLEILKEVRADPALAHLPVIILTAASEPEIKYRALLTGATGFLSKPVDFTELFAAIRNALVVKTHHDELTRCAKELDHRVQERTAELAMSRLEVVQCLARAAECGSSGFRCRTREIQPSGHGRSRVARRWSARRLPTPGSSPGAAGSRACRLTSRRSSVW